MEKVLADPIIKEMIEQCWIDGANIYIKQDPEILKKDPKFRERRFTAPKRISSYSNVLMIGPFKRMRYEEAIEWLAEKAAEGETKALNKEGQVHTFGMDIEEGHPANGTILTE